MAKLRSWDELRRLQAEQQAIEERPRLRLLVCCGTGCLASGAADVAAALEEEMVRAGVDAELACRMKLTGCHGLCQGGPLLTFEPSGLQYHKVKVKDVAEIVARTVAGGETIERLAYRDSSSKQRIPCHRDIPFYGQQTRVAMRNVGQIDPRQIGEAIARGAYQGLAKALFAMTPDEVLAEVEKSGLRGRGGGGFPTGRKWRSCKSAPGERRFVLCNGDEGDPGAFKDHVLMQGDPHAVLEGMAIGAYALGSREGYLYVRDEYPLAVTSLRHALDQARAHGLLGENVLGSGFSFDVQINRGGGAFVCGESSALMRSLEGKTGEPRAKYIHSTEKGLHDLPTVLNNVETWADVPMIVLRGGEWFAAMGTRKSKGTKAFSLVGKVRNTGLIELPMGMSLRQIIFGIGGGILENRPFKAVQTGGPSGGCLPESMLDLPVDYEELSARGSMMGSGGMIVMDDRTCMVDVARYFLRFLTEESCGKCVPCREGLRQMLIIFDDLALGRARAGDIERIETLAAGIKDASLCELGKSAPNPVLSTLANFRAEYEAHVHQHRCPAGICSELTRYYIVGEKCNGCGACLRVCPVGAIEGVAKQLHVLDDARCIRCGVCYAACKLDAIGFAARFPEGAASASAAGAAAGGATTGTPDPAGAT